MKGIKLQNVKIVLFGLLTAVFLILLVIEFLPTAPGLEISEKIKVYSSPIDSTKTSYDSYVAGELFNPTDEEKRIDTLTVTVGDGEQQRQITVKDITVPVRDRYTLHVSWAPSDAYDRVLLVSVTSGGETVSLENPTQTWGIGGGAILYAALCLCFAACFLHVIRIRYYMEQEKKLRDGQNTTERLT